MLGGGAPDPSFADNGTFVAAQNNLAPVTSQGRASLLRDRGVALARIDDGWMLADIVLSDGQESLRVVRLSVDGEQDLLFGDGGSLVLNNTSVGYWEPRMAIAPTAGQLLIAGQGFSSQGGTDLGVLRLVELVP